MVTGKVDDVRPYFAQALLSVVPLRMGGGTRLKILESLAMGRSVVTTRVGCEGLTTENEKNLLVCEQEEQFANAVVRLMQDTAFRQRLAKNGRQLVETQYSWNYIAQAVADIWQCLIEKN